MKTLITLLILCLSSATSFAQSIQSFYPSEGRRNAEVSFDLQGTGTLFSQSSTLTATLKSNVDASVITISTIYAADDSYCYGTFSIPATATPGSYSLSLLTTNQGKLTKANVFTVSNDPPLPQIISISPNTAQNGAYVQTTIYVRYAHFLSASFLDVILDGWPTYINADSIVVVNDTTLTAFFDIPATSPSSICNVTVSADNDYVYLYSGFTIDGLDPDILSVSPNSASNGTHVDVTINTTETMFTQVSSLSVTLQGMGSSIYSTSVSVLNDTTLLASFDIPLRTRTSMCNVIVYMDWESLYEWGAFSIEGINPVMEAVSPAEAAQGETLDIILSGSEMYFTEASYIEATFYSMDGNGYFTGINTIALNDDQVKTTITIPSNAQQGSYMLYLSIDGDYNELYDAFTVLDDGIPDPALTAISPNSAQKGQVLNVTISGSSTAFTQASSIEVFLEGNNNLYQASSVAAISNTQLQCTFYIPNNATTGRYDVFVSLDNENPLVLENGFTIMPSAGEPALVSISPAMTFPGQTLDVTITGVNTHFMASSTSLDMAIYSQATSIYVSPTSFTATSNTTIIARFEIPDDFPLGVYDFGVYSTIDGLLELLQSVIVNAVGLNEEEGLIGKLYPNPVHDNLHIETQQPTNRCTIVDITGKQILVDINEIKQDPTHLVIPIDKLGLRKGIYFIRLESDNGFDYQKFIVD